MKKTLYLTLLFLMLCCMGCGGTKKETPKNEESPKNESVESDKISDDAPCKQILNASLADGMVQIGDMLFKADGVYTFNDAVAETEKKHPGRMYLSDYGKNQISLEDYIDGIDQIGFYDSQTGSECFFLYEKKLATSKDSLTVGESIVGKYRFCDAFYSLANGLREGLKISEEELQAYLEKEGLTENTESGLRKNTYIRSESDGIPSYNLYVVSNANPDVVIQYYIWYKSESVLGECTFQLQPAQAFK